MADTTPDPDGDRDAGSDPDPGPEADGDPERASIRCPFCGSTDTRRELRRGPALCRSVHYCLDCEQPFEEFG